MQAICSRWDDVGRDVWSGNGAYQMRAITIPLSDGQLTNLQEMALRLRVPPETLLAAALEALLNRPDEEFQRTMEYVLQKNEELYRRLAVGG